MGCRKHEPGFAQAAEKARANMLACITGGLRTSNKAQATLELLFIFAGAMLILAIVAAVLPSQAAGSQSSRDRFIASSSAFLMAQACDEVYLAGEGASKQVWFEIPEAADSSKSFFGARSNELNWTKRKMIDINMLTEGDVFAITRAPTCGFIPSKAGRYRLTVSYNGTGTAHVSVNGNC